MTERRSNLGLGIGIAAGGLAFLLLTRKKSRDLIRERSRESIEFLKARAARLRAAAEDLARMTKGFVGPPENSVRTDTEGEKQAYQEEKRNNMGG